MILDELPDSSHYAVDSYGISLRGFEVYMDGCPHPLPQMIILPRGIS